LPNLDNVIIEENLNRLKETFSNDKNIDKKAQYSRQEKNRQILFLYLAIHGRFPNLNVWQILIDLIDVNDHIYNLIEIICRLDKPKEIKKLAIHEISGIAIRCGIQNRSSKVLSGISLVSTEIEKLLQTKKIVFSKLSFIDNQYIESSASEIADTSHKKFLPYGVKEKFSRIFNNVIHVLKGALYGAYREILSLNPENRRKIQSILAKVKYRKRIKILLHKRSSDEFKYIILPRNLTLISPTNILNEIELEYLEVATEAGLLNLIPIIHDLLPLSNPNLFQNADISPMTRYMMLIAKTRYKFAVSRVTRMSYIDWCKAFSLEKQHVKILDIGCLVVNRIRRESRLLTSYSKSMQVMIPEKPYFLMISTIEPRKGYIQVIRAFEKLSSTYPELHMVFVGNSGWKNEPIINFLTSSKSSKKILLRRNVSEIEKILLIQNSISTIYASKKEGYGIPVAESVLLGKMVVMHSAAPMNEIPRLKVNATYCNMGNWMELYISLKKILDDYEQGGVSKEIRITKNGMNCNTKSITNFTSTLFKLSKI